MRTDAAAHTAGMLGFLALFPGFFFYHTALGLGKIPAFLGGYFAPVSLLVTPLLLFCYAGKLRRDPDYLGKTDVAFFLYLAYFGLVVALHGAAGTNHTIFTSHVLALLYMFDTFLIFRMSDFGQRRLRLLTLASLIGMSVIVFAYAVDGAFYLAPLGTAKNPESLASYQGFSRSYLFTFAPAIAFTRARSLRLALYCLAAPTLYMNTARSEFVAMLFMIPVIELYHTRQKMFMTSVFLVLSLALYANLDQLLSLLPSNRTLELLDLSQSTSASKRHDLTVYAIESITRFPIFGDYANYTPGFYAHNVLSAWVDTGIFGFAFLNGLLITPAAMLLLNGYFSRSRSSEYIHAFSLSCITLLLLMSSHYFTDMLIGATLATYSAYRYGVHHAHHCPPDLGPSAPGHPDFHQAVPEPGAPRS
ncbi:hypothetical protein LXA47_23225 [Massilia sp. P8910]|nr:hypothetical protein [Massilia antarctica]MCE3606495.1 hypothetical protein [Massilia antarctica]CUI08903.1 hypothetical protein BN2497_12583 [Janthinobacterium sp. CG23_2]CUU32689.1 hypothetical protein BN3177_12583 [Janthinobacterium sp. CG23_2]